MRNSVKSKIKYLIKESLRPRTLDDYREFFSRGMKNDDGEAPQIPWLWLRALALGFVIFAVAMLGYRLSSGSVDYMTVIVCGGLCVNIPVLAFYYELYPKRDLSIILLLLIVFAGGVLSIAAASLGYEYIYDDPFNSQPWVSMLWTGFWEELVKGAVAISAIALLKKKNPFVCFLIGFAVGTGFSFFEDLGYIYSYSGGRSFHWVVLMSLGRGLSCAFSHAPWTGLICWAFAAFKRPFINFRFYGIAVACMALHYLADVTFFVEELDVLSGITWGYAIDAFVVAAAVVLQYFVLRSAQKELISPICGGQFYKETEFVNIYTPVNKAERLSAAGNLAAVLCAVAVSAFSLIGCSLYTVRTELYTEFYDGQSFVDYIQEGLPLSADLTRGYDSDSENYSQLVAEGDIKYAVQKQTDGDYDYFYIYGFTEDKIYLESVAVKIEGAIYYCAQLIVYEYGYTVITYYPERFNPIFNDPPEEEEPTDPPEEEEVREPLTVLTFFEINRQHKSYDYGKQCFRIREGYETSDNTAGYIVLGVLSGIAAAGGIAAYTVLKTKARRIKNDR